MQEPRCIAQLLTHHQVERPLDFTITHGKGRKGIIIRQQRGFSLSSVLLNCLKKWSVRK